MLRLPTPALGALKINAVCCRIYSVRVRSQHAAFLLAHALKINARVFGILGTWLVLATYGRTGAPAGLLYVYIEGLSWSGAKEQVPGMLHVSSSCARKDDVAAQHHLLLHLLFCCFAGPGYL